MIRIKMQLVPAGVGELAQDFADIIIGCKFPIDNPAKQDLFVISQGFYTELKAYDLQSTLYAPSDGKPKAINLCVDAIRALQTTGRRIIKNAVYPGALSIEPKEFYKVIADIAERFPQVQEVILFGRRAHEQIGTSKFFEAHNAHRAEVGGYINGGFYLSDYPAYIPYHVAIKLSDESQDIERQIIDDYTLREYPHAPEMQCYNNIDFNFIRQDGRIAAMIPSREISNTPPAVKVYPVQISTPILTQIRAGRVIFKRENGEM